MAFRVLNRELLGIGQRHNSQLDMSLLTPDVNSRRGNMQPSADFVRLSAKNLMVGTVFAIARLE